MKVTEVRTARSCASWLLHYRSRGRFCLPLLFSVASRREISSSCHRSSAARILALHHLSSSALFGNRTLSITLHPRRLIAHAQLAYRSRNLRSA
jgi:hypothetical protein